MKKDGNPAVRFWLLSIYGSRVMFQWQAVERGGLNPTIRVNWDLCELKLLTQRETFGPGNHFQSEGLTKRSQPHEKFRVNQSISKYNTIVINNI
jgi:hypothetical protein